MPSHTVPGFLPSTSGLRFANSFPHVPVRRIGIPGVLSVPIGDASNGLCGGMAFAARDYFEAHRPPPADTTAPGSGPLFDYLVDRLFDSFDLPFGPVKYLQLMSPAMPDADSVLSRIGLAPHGRAWRTIVQEWPTIRADLDAGHPSPLGLVRIRSTNPVDLKQNHQVLAYGYDLEGTALTLRVYDPNWPGRDDATFSLDIGSPTRAVTIEPVPPGPPVLAFFRVGYRSAAPP
jgi:hypothetical protein